MPVTGSRHTRGAVGPVNAGAISRVTSPATDVQLTAALVGQSYTGGAENVGLDVEGTESQGSEVKLVGTRLIARSGTTLGDERDLAGDGLLGDERDVDTIDQELVPPGPVILREVPRVKGRARPEVRGQTAEATANIGRVADAIDGALGLRTEGGSTGGNVGRVAAIAFLAVFQASSGVAVRGALVQAHVRCHCAGEEELPEEGALLVDVILDATLIGPVAIEIFGLRCRGGVDLRGSLGNDAHPVASTALLSRVARTINAALRVGRFRTTVDDGVTAEALNSVLGG